MNWVYDIFTDGLELYIMVFIIVCVCVYVFNILLCHGCPKNTVNEAFERVASFGLVPNMIFYLMGDYNLGFAKGNNLIFYWSAATQFMPILGAFLSDSYLGRFLTIVSGSMASFLVIILSILLFSLFLGTYEQITTFNEYERGIYATNFLISFHKNMNRGSCSYG